MMHAFLPILARRRLLSWLLSLSLIVMALQPMHVHVVHEQGMDGVHVSQVHAVAEPDGPNSDSAHTLDPFSDRTVKSFGFSVPLLALLFSLWLLLPPAVRTYRSVRSFKQPLFSIYRHRTPPLRAPPGA